MSLRYFELQLTLYFCSTRIYLCIFAGSTQQIHIYYSWTAATAGTGTSSVTSGDAPSSVCPKGWKLPPNSGKGSYTNFTSAAGITNSADGSNKIRSAPYNFPYAGNVVDSALNNVGSDGRYWSRTAYSTNGAYNLYFNSTYVNPANLSSRYDGFSVRCVATT